MSDKPMYSFKKFLQLEHYKIIEEVGDVVVLQDLSIPSLTYKLPMKELQNKYEWWLKCWDFLINHEYLNIEPREDKEQYKIDKYLW